MALTTLAAIAALGLSLQTTAPDVAPVERAAPLTLAQNAPLSDYMTTPDGCTYRKTQAPGYPVRWILVVNPHHIGAAPATRRCKGML